MCVLVSGLPSSGSRQQSMMSLTGSSDQVYLKPVKYVPDFNVKAITDMLILRIRRPHYVAALRATLMERAPKSNGSNAEDHFSKEWKRAISVPDPDHPKMAYGGTDANSADIQAGSKETLSSPTAEQDGLIPDGRTRSETQDSLEADRSADAGTPLIISSSETMPETINEAKS